MFLKKKGEKDNSRDRHPSIKVYPDGAISMDPEEVLRQCREELKYSGQSDLPAALAGNDLPEPVEK